MLPDPTPILESVEPEILENSRRAGGYERVKRARARHRHGRDSNGCLQVRCRYQDRQHDRQRLKSPPHVGPRPDHRGGGGGGRWKFRTADAWGEVVSHAVREAGLCTQLHLHRAADGGEAEDASGGHECLVPTHSHRERFQKRIGEKKTAWHQL